MPGNRKSQSCRSLASFTGMPRARQGPDPPYRQELLFHRSGRHTLALQLGDRFCHGRDDGRALPSRQRFLSELRRSGALGHRHHEDRGRRRLLHPEAHGLEARVGRIRRQGQGSGGDPAVRIGKTQDRRYGTHQRPVQGHLPQPLQHDRPRGADHRRPRRGRRHELPRRQRQEGYRGGPRSRTAHRPGPPGCEPPRVRGQARGVRQRHRRGGHQRQVEYRAGSGRHLRQARMLRVRQGTQGGGQARDVPQAPGHHRCHREEPQHQGGRHARHGR